MSDDELLGATPQAANDLLRTRVLARTTGQIRFRRRVRMASRVGICVLCFAAGAITIWFRPTAEPRIVYVEVAVEAPAKSELPVPAPSPPLSPVALELAAEQMTEKVEAARRFREAGDRYLKDAADYQSALRCYRNFLDGADAADLVVSPSDSWLLTSLKRAREQENVQ